MSRRIRLSIAIPFCQSRAASPKRAITRGDQVGLTNIFPASANDRREFRSENMMLFSVELEASPIEISGADQPYRSIDQHGLGVEQPQRYSKTFTPALIKSP
jgi:hypothetical protein